uniref:CUB domain-containing protein n=1 Tax=Panagrolaimus sp. JU765 TaxID=591449 RepID=A0AC34QUA0_9BILA
MIIPLYANGNQSLNVFDVCQWNFVVPSNFKLKIVVTSLFGKELTIKTADYQGQIIKPGVYYFDNPTIEIYYRKYLNMTYGLQGYVTLVSRSNSTTTTNCHQKTDGNVVIYSNSANNQGYENDWACSTNLQNIQANRRYLFTVTKPFYENLGDQLRLKDPTVQNGTYLLSYDSPMVFDSSFKTDLQLEFISDGSVVQNGFEVQQVEQNCSCPVVELMPNCNSSLASYTFAGYCINVNCTYTLKINPACPDKLISLYITSKLTTKPIYIFVITIGQSSPNYIIGTGKYDYLSYLPTTKIMFQLASNPIMISPYFFPYISVEISTDEPPKFSNVELTADNPLFVLDLKTDSNNYNISVPVGQTLEMILTSTEDVDYYDLYDGPEYFGGFYRVVITSDDKQLPRYTSKHGYMIVFNKYRDYGYSSNMVVIFRNVEIHSQNCDTKNNVLKMPELNGNLQMANGVSSPCMWTILKYNYDGTDSSYLITEMMTTIEDKITVIPDVDSKHPLFSFSNSDASKWNAIVLSNVVNTFILPNSGQLTMNLKKLNSNFFDFGSNPPKNITGIVYFPSYANPNAPLMNNTTLMNIRYTTDESVFVCKALDLGIGDIVAINEIPVIHVGQNITIKNAAEIAVTFTSKTLGKRGFLLEYSSKINQTDFNSNSKSAPRFAFNFLIFGVVIIFVKF